MRVSEESWEPTSSEWRTEWVGIVVLIVPIIPCSSRPVVFFFIGWPTQIVAILVESGLWLSILGLILPWRLILSVFPEVYLFLSLLLLVKLFYLLDNVLIDLSELLNRYNWRVALWTILLLLKYLIDPFACFSHLFRTILWTSLQSYSLQKLRQFMQLRIY